ncbi:MAG: dTDP-4-dehydrorhamnose 3,5-epimerase [Bdellovibrio sp.]|nr:MAG: dTDP-4-dehydrorhamnose 3,5-epimerase [Bdellovibrio sp.]
MIFEPLKIPGSYLVRLDQKADERGFFARSFCEDEFKAHGLHSYFPQSNVSFNQRTGTFRGMHFQLPPAEEVKVVRCTHGAAMDVILDLRSESPKFRQWVGIEISAENHNAVYIPKGCAHGFQTLRDETELLYLMGERFDPTQAKGVRWNDSAFDIRLPLPISVISEKDKSYPLFGS